MILRSTTAADAEDEHKILRWFEENFGRTDASDLSEWVWSRERDGARYVAALWHIAREYKKREGAEIVLEDGTKEDAAKDFLRNLLAQARRPAIEGEAEIQLMEAVRPHIERVQAEARRHPGDPAAVEAGLREIRVRLRETLHRMWPDKHRASVDGAIMSGTMTRGTSSVIDFRKIVQALMRHDEPLKATAKMSHAVTDDR